MELAGPLRLREFTVRFHPCPDIDPVKPFVDWTADQSSKSLVWYAAYNGVKHDREYEFARASLRNAFDAIAACAVMLVAQFGHGALTRELSSFLSVDAPSWPIDEMYLMPEAEQDWHSVPHPGLA